MHPYLTAEYPVRFAHRGSRILWPENTLPAFAGAIDLGYRYIETDVQMTSDDVVVVFHDPTLDRLTNARGRVRDWAWDDLRHLDAAWSFDPAGGYPLRGQGVGISRLDDVLRTWPDVRFNIDLKAPGLEWPVAEVIKRTERSDSVLVASFAEHRLAKFRRITHDTVPTSAGMTAAVRMWAASRRGGPAATKAVAFQIPFDHRVFALDAALVDAVHEAGAQVHAWTVNDAVDMERLLDMGVDGIVSDRPDILNDVVAGRTASG